jgi:hypothetical protein
MAPTFNGFLFAEHYHGDVKRLVKDCRRTLYLFSRLLQGRMDKAKKMTCIGGCLFGVNHLVLLFLFVELQRLRLVYLSCVRVRRCLSVRMKERKATSIGEAYGGGKGTEGVYVQPSEESFTRVPRGLKIHALVKQSFSVRIGIT